MATTFSETLSFFIRRHPAVSVFTGINIGVSAIIWVIWLIGLIFSFDTDFIDNFLSLPASIELLSHRPWTVATYMVTHYSPLHLLFNMLWLIWFAALIDTLTPRKFTFLYIGGGLMGALFFVIGVPLLGEPANSTLCGASASVMGILSAAALVEPNRRIGLLLFGSVKLKWIALAALVLSFLGMGGGNAGGQLAHIGGVTFGILFGIIALRGVKIQRLRRQRKPTARLTEKFLKTLEDKDQRQVSDTERLDQLLDKIRISGYGSLSYSERNELIAISKRLDT